MEKIKELEERIKTLEDELKFMIGWSGVANQEMVDFKKSVRNAIKEHQNGNSEKALEIISSSAVSIYMTDDRFNFQPQ